jgi:hypothetical protein
MEAATPAPAAAAPAITLDSGGRWYCGGRLWPCISRGGALWLCKVQRSKSKASKMRDSGEFGCFDHDTVDAILSPPNLPLKLQATHAVTQ